MATLNFSYFALDKIGAMTDTVGIVMMTLKPMRRVRVSLVEHTGSDRSPGKRPSKHFTVYNTDVEEVSARFLELFDPTEGSVVVSAKSKTS